MKQINPMVSQNMAMILKTNVPTGVCQLEIDEMKKVDPKVINYLTDDSTSNMGQSLYPSARGSKTMINFLANLVSQKQDKLKQGQVQLTKNQTARTKADRKRIL